ncbi:hypothetical protein M0R19_01315 [Candidatus Pacearchaeota archaeon]|nr:hypothetical protein [Candidatus Pacearchaeota archaeon]
MSNIKIYIENEKGLNKKIGKHSVTEYCARSFWFHELNLNLKEKNWKENPNKIIERIKRKLKEDYYNPHCNTIVLTDIDGCNGKYTCTWKGYRIK